MYKRQAEPDFLDHHREIIDLYARLGVRTIQSCVPYEWEGVVAAESDAPVAWAESNAICFANSYCGLRTNRESGLSALACALTGYAPDYGPVSYTHLDVYKRQVAGLRRNVPDPRRLRSGEHSLLWCGATIL